MILLLQNLSSDHLFTDLLSSVWSIEYIQCGLLLPTPEAGAELLGHDLPLGVGLLVVIKHVVVLTPGQMHVVLGDDSCDGPYMDLVN